MMIFIMWIIGSILAIYMSIELMRLDEEIMYRPNSDIKDDFMLMVILSAVGTWIFAALVGCAYIFKKYEKNIVRYIKGINDEE